MVKFPKVVLAIILGAILAGGGFGLILWQKKAAVGSPLGRPTNVSPTQSPEKLLTWNDPAGFTFQYPDGLNLNKHDEDNLNYAHLEFTNKDHPGTLIVWAKDTITDLSSWIKSDTRFNGANILDTTFAGQPGKKVLVATPSSLLVTGTIAEGILFSVETNLTEIAFWTKVHETVAGSFAFAAQSEAGGDVPVDEEEIIQ